MANRRQDWNNPDSLLSVDEARDRILKLIQTGPVVETPLAEATGLVLAADIRAGTDLPPFANSAMDGFALRSQDTADAPVSLTIAGTVAAGNVAEHPLAAGQTLRIMTGAPVPAGADAVIRLEEVEVSGDQAAIRRFVPVGENIRPAGEDVRQGEVALHANSRLGAGAIGLLAALGIDPVPAYRRPAVGILATGDELAAAGESLRPGMIRNSNSPMLAAAIRQAGAVPVELGAVGDTLEQAMSGLEKAMDVDLLVTTGGVSVGDRDIVKDVLLAAGDVELHGLRMKPGKPLAFGMVGRIPVVALPGNPVAALVGFDQFVRPSILKLLGRQDLEMPVTVARLASPVVNRGGRRLFVRGSLTGPAGAFVFEPETRHGSGLLSTVAGRRCYLDVPEDQEHVEAGEIVTVQLPEEGL